MKLFRNPEIRISAVVCLLIAFAGCTAGFIYSVYAGALAAVICLMFISIYFFSAYRRYKALAELVADIDSALHGNEDVSFARYSEGELSLLQNELIKLTVRLREQADTLKREKIVLADSIADISHQIRTPLTSINLVLSLLNERELSEQKRRECLRELERLMARIEWLIASLLKISRLDAGTVVFKRDVIGLEALIKKAAAPLEIQMEIREQSLRVCAEGDFTGDLLWTAEALGNIIKNCTEHMGAGGTLTVNARENPMYSEITVHDTGPGIDKEDLPRLFERFYKGANAGEQSVGIGLALARMIITGQNGTVKAENAKEGGALFTIRFYKGTV